MNHSLVNQFATEFKKYWLDYFLKWISRRQPTQNHYVLNQRNLYIFPTKTGWSFLLLSVVVWLMGTNYQNNLILALSYMLIGVFIVSILNTFNNLSGLEIVYRGAEKVYAGERLHFTFSVRTKNKIGTHYLSAGVIPQFADRKVSAKNLDRSGMQHYDFTQGEDSQIQVSVHAQARGLCRPRYLLVESYYPMGILRCWTWLIFEEPVIVFPEPKPREFPAPKNIAEQGKHGQANALSGDDFFGLRQYQAGDSVKHIAWKHYAQADELLLKQFGEPGQDEAWLDWDDFYSGDVELALSHMCYCARDLNKQKRQFGLKLADLKIGIGVGGAHLEKILTELALFKPS